MEGLRIRLVPKSIASCPPLPVLPQSIRETRTRRQGGLAVLPQHANNRVTTPTRPVFAPPTPSGHCWPCAQPGGVTFCSPPPSLSPFASPLQPTLPLLPGPTPLQGVSREQNQAGPPSPVRIRLSRAAGNGGGEWVEGWSRVRTRGFVLKRGRTALLQFWSFQNAGAIPA